MAQLRNGDFESAAETLQAAVDRDPSLAPTHNLLGLTWTKLGEREKAAAAFELALAADPSFEAPKKNLEALRAGIELDVR